MRPALALALALPFFVGCSTHPARPTGCASHDECAAGAFCRDGACTGSQPPLARIGAPAAPLLSHVRLAFDGSGSADPDPGDEVSAYAWSARALAAPCEPASPAGGGAVFELLVGCAGTFEVRLEVTDRHGVKSLPAAAPVEVVAHASPPSVAFQGPGPLEHACSGAPLRCSAVDGAGGGGIALRAAASSPAGSGFGWRWVARAPSHLAGAARIAFTPPDAPDTTLSIESDGAIAGDYAVAVEATDALGFVARAEVVLTVGNRPPRILTPAGELFVPHSYDPAQALYLAHGRLGPLEVEDPDGDPVTFTFQAVESGTSAPTLTLATEGASAPFDVAVPGGEPASLMGPAVARAVTAHVEDGNGGAAEASWAVTVTNRAPRRTSGISGFAHHTFDSTALRYLSEMALGSYVDDDGDPMTVAGSGAGGCSELSLSGGTLRVRCSLAYLGSLPATPLAGSHRVEATVSDPWSQVGPDVGLATVWNRSPTIGVMTLPTVAPCCYRSCIQEEWDPALGDFRCLAWGNVCYPNTTPGPTVADPDGDPLLVTRTGTDSFASASPYVVIPTGASLGNIAASGSCATATGSLTIAVSDGVASASSSASTP